MKRRKVWLRELFVSNDNGNSLKIQEYLTQISTPTLSGDGQQWANGLREFLRADNGKPMNVVSENPMVFEDVLSQVHFTEVGH